MQSKHGLLTMTSGLKGRGTSAFVAHSSSQQLWSYIQVGVTDFPSADAF